ncbi:ATP-binding cassette domain-containing protein, partial [Chloroflexota bacterium]
MPLLTVEDLKAYYLMGEATVKAVDGVSFTLDEGDSIGIVGESACGKSTLALSLLRLLKYAKIEGKITLNGQSLLEMPFNQFRHIRQKEMALIHQAAMGGLNPVHTIGSQI